MFGAILDPLITILFPEACLSCRGPVEKYSDGFACSACWDLTRLFGEIRSLCHKCGALLNTIAPEASSVCGECAGYDFDSAAALGAYEYAISASVIGLKSSPRISGRIRQLVFGAVRAGKIPEFDVIIPVPLSAKRMNERGFNQAEMIGGVLKDASSRPVDRYSLKRKIHTPMHRAGMDRKAREITVENAFEIVRPKLIEGKKVLLADDVLTTGATASNCAKVLKKHGASSVSVFTLARAVKSINN